jgi:hypothetical protein
MNSSSDRSDCLLRTAILFAGVLSGILALPFKASAQNWAPVFNLPLILEFHGLLEMPLVTIAPSRLRTA